jgi:hypothetical protein
MKKKNVYRFKEHAGRHRGKDRKIYGPGDTIELYEWETVGFIDKLELVSTGGAVPVEEETPKAPPLEIHPDTENEGKFNVINPGTGSAINSAPLTEEQARALAGPDAVSFIPPGKLGPPSPPTTKRVRKTTSLQATTSGERKLTAIHKGAGRYVVLDENSGEVVAGGDGNYLDKTQAEEMVKPK